MRNIELISVDDHAIEPRNVWQDRLPTKYQEAGPRVVLLDAGPQDSRIPEKQRQNVFTREGGVEFWAYEDVLIPTVGLSATAGMDPADYTTDPVNYDQMREGFFDPHLRIKDMDADGVLASLCFPSMPRFAGQQFLEGKDKTLALLCVQAYNDWMIEEWCGSAPGRLIPLCIVPLWDVTLAIAELERVAGKGVAAIAFSENVAKLGLPSIHDPDRYWDPFFAAAADRGITLCMHVGSSSNVIVTAADAPLSLLVGLVPFNALISCFDWLLSGVFPRHPNLKVALSEGGIGWIPYVLERADYTWENQRHWTETGRLVPEPPSTYFADHMYGCFIYDPHGSEILHKIGIDNVMIETDYPHSDSTWPHSIEHASKALAHLSDEDLYKVTRGNAEKLFRFTPSAIGEH